MYFSAAGDELAEKSSCDIYSDGEAQAEGKANSRKSYHSSLLRCLVEKYYRSEGNRLQYR